MSVLPSLLGIARVIWIGHNSGDVYSTSNGTDANPTWTRRDNTTPTLPNRVCTAVTIDPDDDQRVWVTFGGFNSTNVWYTTDGGSNWTMATGMPALPVRDVQIHPTNKTWIYAATDLGVLASQNNGLSWSMPNEGPANVSIDDLLWIDTVLYVATHGRGLWSQETADAADMTPPTVTCSIARSILWPARNGMMPIGLSAVINDDMDPNPTVMVDIYSSEPEGSPPFAPDATGTSFLTTRLRAQRAFPGPGRIYLLTVSAADDGANVTYDCCTAIVPSFPTFGNILALRASAAAAETFCEANDGQAPAGFNFLHNYEP